MSNQEYNGCTNYATWKINVEFFGGMTEALSAETCKELVEEHIDENAQFLAKDWALSFVNEVNWHEIAEYLNED